MMRKSLKALGYHNIEDAIEFLVCGLATLPAFLMLTGFMVVGAVTMATLLLLVVAVGMHAPPPEPPAERKSGRSDGKPH